MLALTSGVGGKIELYGLGRSPGKKHPATDCSGEIRVKVGFAKRGNRGRSIRGGAAAQAGE